MDVQLAVPLQSNALLPVNENNFLIKISSEPRNMASLQTNILEDVQDVLKGYDETGQVTKQIWSNLKKTDSISDVLFNISILMPQSTDLDKDYEFKPLFDQMYDNQNALKRINMRLGRLYLTVADSMKSYRQKLETLKKQIKFQHHAKSDLKSFIQRYCSSNIQDEFNRIKEHEEVLKTLYEELVEIQEQKEMAKLSDFTKVNVNMDLMSTFTTTDTQVIKLYEKEISNLNMKLEEYDQNILIQEKKLILVEQDLQLSNDSITSLQNDCKLTQQYLMQCQDSLNQKTQERIKIDVEKLTQTFKEEINKKKVDVINKIEQIKEKQKQVINVINAELTKKKEKANTIGKSYHIIMMLDDSVTMHHIQNTGFFDFLKKTPFEYLKESVQQFIQTRKHLQKVEDRISVIKFSKNAHEIHTREAINSIRLKLDNNPQKKGTNFNEAFLKVFEIAKLQSNDQSTIIIFQTDGKSEQKDKCEEYLQKIKDQDQGLKMFTIGLGEKLDEEFLQNITKFVNGGEVMNKGQQNPIKFYQQVVCPEQLVRKFTDIAIGISEQMQEVQTELRNKQTQVEGIEQESKIKIEQLERQFFKEQSNIEDNIREMKKLQTIQETSEFLKSKKEEAEQKKIKAEQLLTEQKTKSRELERELDLFKRRVQETKTSYSNLKLKALEDINKWKSHIEEEKKCNTEHQIKQAQTMRKIGYSNEAKVRIWARVTNWFIYYINIITEYTQKFKLFFEKFKDISENLKRQLDDDDSELSIKVADEIQLTLLNLYFSGETITLSKIEGYDEKKQDENDDTYMKEQIIQKQNVISFETIISTIIKEKYYQSDEEDENAKKLKQALIKVQKIILSTNLNIESLLKDVSFNNPTIQKNKQSNEEQEDENENGSEEDSSKIIQMRKKLQEEQKQELSLLDDQIVEQMEYFLKLRVFSVADIKKLKTINQKDKILAKIEDFDFDAGDDDDEDEEDENEDEDQDDDEDEEREDSDNEQIKKPKKKKSKPKKLSKKKKVKIEKKSDKEIEKLTKEFSKIARSKIDLVNTHKLQLETLNKAYQLIDSYISDILFQFSKSKKSHQIGNLLKYIQSDMIDPLDDLISFYIVKARS